MIRIAFLGDVMFARNVEKTFKLNPNFELLSHEVIYLLQSHDFVVGNLECPVSINSIKSKPNSFKGPPDILNKLSFINLFTLANNHIFDCGKSGAIDTVEYTSQNNQHITGLYGLEGNNAFFKKKIQNKIFSFFSCAVEDCINDPNISEFPFVVKAEDMGLLKLIQEAKSYSNYIIVLVHGGDEMIPYPKPSFRKLCESYVDVGADVVITHHPHVIGGGQRYKNGYIFYSLGDFIFDGESYLRRRGLILSISFDDNKISHNIYPTQINKNLSVDFAGNKNKSLILKNWYRLNNILQKEINYNFYYRLRYMASLFSFQTDRLIYFYRHKGLIYIFLFISSKFIFIPFYLKKIFYNKI